MSHSVVLCFSPRQHSCREGIAITNSPAATTRQLVKRKEKLNDFYMTFTRYQVLDLTCGLVTGMEVDHVLVEFVHVCFLMMALVLPPLLEKAFRMTHASFPHAALRRYPCCRGLRLAVTLFIVLFPAGPGIGLSAQSPDFLRALS